MIARASADIALKLGPDCLLGRVRVALYKVDRAHDHAGSAKAALQAVVFLEGGLHRMQLAILRQTFNGGDLRAVSLNRQHRTGFDTISVNMDGAGTALAGITTNVSAGQSEIFTDKLNEQGVGRNIGANLFPVHRHVNGCHLIFLP